MTLSNKVLTASAKLIAAAIEAPSAPKRRAAAASSRTAVSEPVAATKPTGRKAKAEPTAALLVKPSKPKALTAVEPAPTKPVKAKKVEPAPAVPVQRGMGIGALARKLLLEHPEWPHARVAAEVNARIPGAQSSEKSMRWYSCEMRKKGITGAERVRPEKS